MGHEHDLRRFCQAVRALPIGESIPLKTTPADPKVSAARYADRIGIINDRGTAADVTVMLDRPLPTGKHLYDVATKHVLIETESSNRGSFTIWVEGYDTRTVAVE